MGGFIRHGRLSRTRQYQHSACTDAHVSQILFATSKQQLRDELAEAVRNTAKLPTQTKGESDASDH